LSGSASFFWWCTYSFWGLLNHELIGSLKEMKLKLNEKRQDSKIESFEAMSISISHSFALSKILKRLKKFG
jgi:hypothetical protein